MRIVLAALAGLTLSSCVARTAANIVTAPVKVVGKGVDWATTSQDEADRNRGRQIRKQEEREERERRRAEREYREEWED